MTMDARLRIGTQPVLPGHRDRARSAGNIWPDMDTRMTEAKRQDRRTRFWLRGVIDRSGSDAVLTRLRVLFRSNEFYLIPLALVVGIATGAMVTLMSELAQIAHVMIYGIPIDVRLSANAYVNPVTALVAPACGGLALGVMEWLRRRWKIASAVDPVEANALRGGRMSWRDSVVVSTQTLISNGCGASVGLEAGYTQIGAGAASLLGRFFNLRRNDLRLIVGCGAAGAIAAAFGAPITGAFFACELIVGVYSVASAAPILAASLAGSLTAQWLGGAPYSLEVPKVGAVGVEQYIALIVLALMVSGIGIAVMRLSPLVERLFTRPGLPVWLRPVLGGVCVGAHDQGCWSVQAHRGLGRGAGLRRAAQQRAAGRRRQGDGKAGAHGRRFSQGDRDLRIATDTVRAHAHVRPGYRLRHARGLPRLVLSDRSRRLHVPLHRVDRLAAGRPEVHQRADHLRDRGGSVRRPVPGEGSEQRPARRPHERGLGARGHVEPGLERPHDGDHRHRRGRARPGRGERGADAQARLTSCA